MKKAFKITASALLIALLLCSCFGLHAAVRRGAAELDFLALDDQFVCRSFLREDTLVLITTQINKDAAQEESPSESEEVQPADPEEVIRLIVCDLRKMKITTNTVVDTNGGYYSDCAIDGDRILITAAPLSEDDEFRRITLDFSGNRISESAAPQTDSQPLVRGLVTAELAEADNCRFIISRERLGAVFTEDCDTAYITDIAKDGSLLCAYGSSVAVYDGGAVYIRDFAQKQTIRQAADVGEIYQITAASMNDKYFFYCKDSTDEDGNVIRETPYLWQYSASDDRSPITNLTTIRADEIKANTLAVAENITKQFGVNIIIEEDPEGIPIFDYTFEPMEYTLYQNMQLRVIGDSLAAYPSGLFSELLKRYKLKVALYPVATAAEGGKNTVSGVTFCPALLDTEQVSTVPTAICLDGGCESTVYHELSHVLENVFSQNEMFFGWDWDQLNPDGFEYDGGYDEYFSNSDSSTLDWIFEAGGNPNDWYFYDRYAKTVQTEDIARIFENLMTYDRESGNSEWLKSPHLYQKSKLLCDLMRNCFDSVKNAESVKWEENLKSSADKKTAPEE